MRPFLGAHSQTDCRIAVDACSFRRGVVRFGVVVCLRDGTHRGRDHSPARVRSGAMGGFSSCG